MSEQIRAAAAVGGSTGWYRSLRGPARAAFFSSAGGWGLDAFTYMIFPLTLTAVATTFGLSKGESSWIATSTLVASAVGGALAGVVADRIGRVRVLMLTVLLYSVFTFLCGIAPNFETMLVFRILLGLGFGGEWAAGALLIAELCRPEHRGRVLGAVAAMWNVGWGVAVLLYTVLFSFIPAGTAWRIMFMIGILPALLVLYIRRRVPEPPAFKERAAAGDRAAPLAIFRSGQLRTTIFAVLLATGVQGGNYAMSTWLPTYLSKNRGLNAVGTGGFIAVLIVSGVVGSMVAGYLNDRLGRRPTFAAFALGSAVVIFTYVNIPAGANALLLVLGVPLGFFSSGIFAGFGAYLSELFPAKSRGAGQGFCYNFGRGVGAFFPAVVGYLSVAIGLGGAIAFAAAGYLMALVSLAFLPETKGRTLEV